MTDFSIIKIIVHRFHLYENECYTFMGYIIIIFHDLMVHIGFISNFKCKVLEWGNSEMTMKEPGKFLAKPDLAKRNIQ